MPAGVLARMHACVHACVRARVCGVLASTLLDFLIVAHAAIAQLVARRSHNPKVVSSILTRRNFCNCLRFCTWT